MTAVEHEAAANVERVLGRHDAADLHEQIAMALRRLDSVGAQIDGGVESRPAPDDARAPEPGRRRT